MLRVLMIQIVGVMLGVGAFGQQPPIALSGQKVCAELEQGYGQPQTAPVVLGEPYSVPKLKLQITDKRTSAPIIERQIIVRYVWRWFEYPYQEHPGGVWSDANDLVKCTSDKFGQLEIGELQVVPRGWYAGEKLKGRKPVFSHLDISVHLDKQITHVRVQT